MRRLVVGFDQTVKLAALVLLVVLLGVITLGVVSRGIGDPLIWTDELSRFLMIWLAVAGWLLASRHQAHIRIRYFAQKLPPSGQRVVEFLLQLGVAGFGALVAWQSWFLVLRNIELEATTLPISMSVMYAPLVLAGVVTLIQALSDAAGTLRGAAPNGGAQ